MNRTEMNRYVSSLRRLLIGFRQEKSLNPVRLVVGDFTAHLKSQKGDESANWEEKFSNRSFDLIIR